MFLMSLLHFRGKSQCAQGVLLKNPEHGVIYLTKMTVQNSYKFPKLGIRGSELWFLENPFKSIYLDGAR